MFAINLGNRESKCKRMFPSPAVGSWKKARQTNRLNFRGY
jgi:hypothetical protein